MVTIIYKTTNLTNGKIYVGKHIQEGLEFDGYLGSGTVLRSAMRKYGKENFKRETLEIVCNQLTNVDDREKFWIAKLDSRNPLVGYNLTEGGDGFNSKIFKELWKNPKYRDFQLKRLKNLWTEKRKIKHSELMTEKWKDREYKNKLLKIFNSSEAKNKNSASQKKVWSVPDYRKKSLNTLEEIRNAPQTKQKVSIKMRDLWKDPNYRNKQIDSLNKVDVKIKQSNSMKNNSNGLKYKYVIKDIDGNIGEVFNLNSFCQEHELNKNKMYKVLNGLTKFYDGWTLISKIFIDAKL